MPVINFIPRKNIYCCMLFTQNIYILIKNYHHNISFSHFVPFLVQLFRRINMNTVKRIHNSHFLSTQNTSNLYSRRKIVSNLYSRRKIVSNLYSRRKIVSNKRKINQDISIEVVNKITNSNNHLILRFVWLVALIIMISLCSYQLYRCFALYFGEPVIKQVNIIRSSHVTFPAIYLCDGALRNYLQHFVKHREFCTNNKISCWISDPMERLITSFMSFDSRDIKTNGFEEKNIYLYQMCNSGSENCEDDGELLNVNKSLIETFWGKCLVFNTSKEVNYRGPFTYVKMKIKMEYIDDLIQILKHMHNSSTNSTEKDEIEKSLDKTRIGATIAFYQTFSTDRQHFLFYDVNDIYLGFETSLQLRQRQFELINRSSSICNDEEFVFKCLNDCIELNLSKICSPPVYNVPNKPKCKQDREYVNLLLENFKAYSHLNFGKCNCPFICNEVSYNVYPTIVKQLRDRDYMIILIHFTDSNIESTTERYSYNFTSLLSDIGGSLGFFLGFSCLTCVEIIESVVRFFRKKVLL